MVSKTISCEKVKFDFTLQQITQRSLKKKKKNVG